MVLPLLPNYECIVLHFFVDPFMQCESIICQEFIEILRGRANPERKVANEFVIAR